MTANTNSCLTCKHCAGQFAGWNAIQCKPTRQLYTLDVVKTLNCAKFEKSEVKK